MIAQTISLFRYLLLSILNKRLFALILILIVVAILLAGFVSELAIINSQRIASALIADFLRYSFVFMALLVVTTSVAEDYEFRQFERLLTMPVSRWQYIAAQFLVIMLLGAILCTLALLILVTTNSLEIGLYWALAMWLEIILVGLLGLLAALSLEKVPLAVFFSLAVYLLAKLSGLISQMLLESVELSDGSAANRLAELIFGAILYLMPGLDAFAQNDIFFQPTELAGLLITQLGSVSVYVMFLMSVCLIDFYRKEFNL